MPRGIRFNRNIMGCKGDINDLSDKLNDGFNRNIMGCKVTYLLSQHKYDFGFNRNIMGCKDYTQNSL